MIEENRSVGRYGKYRVESGVDVEEQSLRSSAVRLVSNPLVAELLLEQNLKWYGASREREGLDIKIVAKTERDSELIGMNGLFGQKKCVGIAFARENESYEDVMERLRKNSWLNNHLEQGAEVAVLGVTKMDNWCEYYEQIREDGWEEMLGRKSLDCSGLDVMNESRVSGLWSAMDGLVRRDWDGWAKVMEGAGRPAQMSAELEPEGSKFDVVFVDRKDEKGSVWMHNVRVSKGMKGQLLEEEVLSEPVRVFGWVVRKPGENMREAYHRAENLRRYWKGRAENGDRVEVPVVSDGQLSLWRKLSSVEKVEAGVEVELTVDEVIKYLYLGKSNLGPGPFSQAGLSLPGRAREMHGTDIIFYGRNDENEREYVAVPNMVCWDMAKLRRGKEELVALNNVGGIIILPDEMDPSEMSRRMREAAMMYNRTTRGKKKNILID